jgi:hypothetical protein
MHLHFLLADCSLYFICNVDTSASWKTKMRFEIRGKRFAPEKMQSLPIRSGYENFTSKCASDRAISSIRC